MESILAFLEGHGGAVTALATVVVAVMAVCTGVLTYALARENRMLRKAGTEPEVAAYLMVDRRQRGLVNLVIANIGRGPARNVRFEMDADEDDLAKHKVLMRRSAGEIPITLLPQDERLVSVFGMGPDLLQDPPLRPFAVRVEYQDLKGRPHQRRYTLDVSQFEGIIFSGPPTDHEMAEALKKIADRLDRFGSGQQRLKVETITKQEAHEDAAEQRRQAEETIKRRLGGAAKGTGSGE